MVLRIRLKIRVTGQRWPAFSGSFGLHSAAIGFLVLSPGKPLVTVTPAVAPHYSVRVVHLQMPREDWASAPAASSESEAAKQAVIAKHAKPAKRAKSADKAPAEPSIAREHRRFQLPPDIRKQPVTQTLVQMDVPPDITLKQEIPLPTALQWAQTIPPPTPVRQFVAPPVTKPVEIPKSLPAAPALTPPNRETAVANLSVAAAPVTETPHLTHPATIASPVSSPGSEPAKEIPQVGLASSAQPSAAGLISLSNTPLSPTPVAMLPPANQIAASDRANGGSAPGDGGSSPRGPSSPVHSATSPGADAVAAQGKGNTGTAPAPAEAKTEGKTEAKAKAPISSNSSGTVAASPREIADSNHGNAATTPVNKAGEAGSAGKAAAMERAPLSIPGTTRITQPRDGKFGVVVQGSADSSRYPQSAGALSGKVVYTVYLRMGLRKNWILQYCLPKSAGVGSIPVDAPWPFEMLRPDRWGDTDSDYVMVKGVLTSAGQFEQLAMVFPDTLETRDLLLASLKGWAFRPASRDGEPTAVEVLLIIPRQAE